MLAIILCYTFGVKWILALQETDYRTSIGDDVIAVIPEPSAP